MVISLLLLIWSAANKRLGVGTFSTPAARAFVEWMDVLLHRDLLVMSPFVPSLLTQYWNTLFWRPWWPSIKRLRAKNNVKVRPTVQYFFRYFARRLHSGPVEAHSFCRPWASSPAELVSCRNGIEGNRYQSESWHIYKSKQVSVTNFFR
jgi:hypothetical protein